MELAINFTLNCIKDSLELLSLLWRIKVHGAKSSDLSALLRSVTREGFPDLVTLSLACSQNLHDISVVANTMGSFLVQKRFH